MRFERKISKRGSISMISQNLDQKSVFESKQEIPITITSVENGLLMEPKCIGGTTLDYMI